MKYMHWLLGLRAVKLKLMTLSQEDLQTTASESEQGAS